MPEVRAPLLVLAKETRQRTGIVAFEQSFHGRTMGALSVTWDDHYRAPFAPLLSDVQFVSPKDPKALLAAVTESTGAIIVEPLQGEGGVRPFSQEMADAVKEACRKTGALLIADEIQCGLGRTGRAFYSQALGLEPDLMAVGKALGGGRSDRGGAVQSSASRKRRRSAITAARMAATFWRAAPRWCFSRS